MVFKHIQGVQRRIQNGGFTLVEVLIAIGILAIMAAISVVVFKNVYIEAVRKEVGTEIVTALSEARAKTLASSEDTVYGVQLSSTTITKFSGSTYIAGAASNIVYTFPGNITATSSLITAGGSVLFTRLSGVPSQQGTIYVRTSDSTGTSTITIHASGLIEYEY